MTRRIARAPLASHHSQTALRAGGFSARLACRILAVAGSSSLGVAYGACGGSGSEVAPTTAVSSAPASSGSSKGAGGARGVGGAPNTMASSAVSGTAGDPGFVFDAFSPDSLAPPPNGPSCLRWPEDAGACPTDPAVIVYILNNEHGCTDGGNVVGTDVSSVVSGPTDGGTTAPDAGDAGDSGDASLDAAFVPEQVCCYEVSFIYCIGGGRPYRTPEGDRVSDLVVSQRTAHRVELCDEERGALAASWARDGLAEHASVASFARFSLALLAHGAPGELVEQAQRAAADEVRHAELCLELASGYGGRVVSPGPFPVASSAGGWVDLPDTLAALAVATVHEGCVGETVSAMLAAEQLARATDPRVRRALRVIAEDEARHAELAWRTVAWAIAVGGDEVARAVEAAFASAHELTPPTDSANEAHGRLDAETFRAVARAALEDLVVPASRALTAPGLRLRQAQNRCGCLQAPDAGETPADRRQDAGAPSLESCAARNRGSSSA